jgi:poly(3-hydroxybutyrate) depolymerase
MEGAAPMFSFNRARRRITRRRLAVLAGASLAAALAAPAAAPAQAPVDCVTRSGPYAAGANCRTVEVDGHPRRFVTYVPATRPTTGERAPVVFMFHGSSGSGEQFLRISGWRQQADANGLVAVFPTGLRYRMLDNGRRSTKWNDGALRSQIDLEERPRGYPDDAPFPADDVGFVDAMLAELEAKLPVDRRRIYASGFSNGANFTARLAVERSTVLAAAGFSAGGLQAQHTPARPIPMSMALGTRDDRVLALTGLAELPLDPVEILTQPVIDAQLDTQLASLGLDPSRYGALARPRYTELRWPAVGSGPGGGVFQFTMLGGLGHKYANAHNNPAGFEAAPDFWRFFAAHPLP